MKARISIKNMKLARKKILDSIIIQKIKFVLQTNQAESKFSEICNSILELFLKYINSFVVDSFLANSLDSFLESCKIKLIGFIVDKLSLF